MSIALPLPRALETVTSGLVHVLGHAKHKHFNPFMSPMKTNNPFATSGFTATPD